MTGGIATGKSYVLSFLMSNGVPVLDCDKIAFEVVMQVCNNTHVHVLSDAIWSLEISRRLRTHGDAGTMGIQKGCQSSGS